MTVKLSCFQPLSWERGEMPQRPRPLFQMTCMAFILGTHTSCDNQQLSENGSTKCHSVLSAWKRQCVCAPWALLCVWCFHVRRDASHLRNSEGVPPTSICTPLTPPSHTLRLAHTDTLKHTHIFTALSSVTTVCVGCLLLSHRGPLQYYDFCCIVCQAGNKEARKSSSFWQHKIKTVVSLLSL